MLDILDSVDQWLSQGRSVALATVVETWGSAPRGVGSKMAVSTDMAMTGSVSGGCVETAVIEEALDCLKKNQSRLLQFGVSDDTAWEVGLTCGGRISVFVEPLDLHWWHTVIGFVRRDIPATTLTVVSGEDVGQKVLFDSADKVSYHTDGLSSEQVATFVQVAQTHHRSGLIEISADRVMLDQHLPRPHLIIIGGVHIAVPLESFARQLGFRVSLIDPRQVFATQERFPEVSSILHSYPDKALPQLGLDRNTYVAVLTHDPKIDDKALLTALPSPVPYVGVLSSRRTHQERLERLRRAGLTEDQLGRIYTPIGLDINARTPEEIALCIMAEVVAVRNGAVL
jgi:xanthine dehydrogenase accessory factor